jgi:putative ABC transport system ATP-binding protein
MIKIQHISKVYNKGQEDEVRALHQVDLAIDKGEFVVIVGTNGSGKSTMLNMLLGSSLPTEGSILINDTNITSLPQHQRSQWISMVFQNPAHGTAPDLTVLENFRLAALRAGRKGLRIGVNENFRKTVADKVATLGMGLENKLDQLMGSLSGGQRQALTLLMGVMDRTDILLMDEPTAAMDRQLADHVTRALQQALRPQDTLVLVTHKPEMLTLVDRLVVIAKHEVLLDGPKEQVLRQLQA